MAKTLKHWGWGYEGDGLSPDQVRDLLATFAEYDIQPVAEGAPPPADALALAPPRLAPPAALAAICTSDSYERALHAFGQSQPDSIRIFARDFAHAPDVVAYPETAADIAALYDWCADHGAALIPFGAGSSVVGGVTPDIGVDFNAVVTLDMSRMDQVLEIDDVSRAARIQGGIRGPALEAALKPSGLTLRHFPQSFEHSTFGGWVATRSGGHFATLMTHIDDLVESVTMVSPAGAVSSRRLPGSGAGPSPDRFMIGSEGALGIITEGWVRLQGRPVHKATAGFRFAKFFDAARAVRAVSQAGLYPANVRIVDGVELHVNGAGDGSFTLMVVSFESSDHPVDAWIARAEECCLDHGGTVDVGWRDNPKANFQGAVGAWREAFIR
ncbi:MAG: FAD-binding oxidoreductase, partial [Pseudomonadota bacterium]